MTDLDLLVDTYCSGWSALTATSRERLLHDALSDDAIYSDPTADRLSVPRLLDHITALRDSLPGVVVRRTTEVDAHHGFARFGWILHLPDGGVAGDGADTISLTSDGARITSVVGFFGKQRPLDAGR